MSEVKDTEFSTAQQLINTVNQKIEERKELTMDELKMICPEIATPEINPTLRQKLGISSRYVHVPTEKVIEDVMKLGWTPINAYRVNTRKARKGTGRHMVKFVNYDFMQEGKTEYPELLLTNSHDGTTSFKLDVGIFRLVCLNGMVVKSQDFGSMKVRHYGYDFETIKGAVNELVEKIPDYLKQVEDMKVKELEREQMMEFARKAAMLRFSNVTEDAIEKVVDLDDFLESTRKEDDGNGLWEVFNRIQEKVVNGKFNYSFTKKDRKARPVKGFKQQVKLNQDLWEIASSYLPETAAV
jgi:uncharacterized protein (DUF2164 family)